ncbi:MAG: 16S rRNA (cytosine(967)-C(5))-methyltransferase RsmB [Acidobacteriota bacterium]|nr:16S rRNA (cytosine(967)-C(5))-methyltransferase RsmB [Blastocatellia bacterium]MDW8240375.1 16S rRNA (cytosine(967)-C(5))-methyltransferase RsmB [Acidobacteriota bacterium]
MSIVSKKRQSTSPSLHGRSGHRSPAISPARREAFRILLQVEQERAYASELLVSAKLDALAAEDRRLVYELVLGVLRWQLQLDYYIAHYATRPVTKLELPVLIALRLGLYQIRFLDRIPDWAAVNESVQLAKRHSRAGATRLVNAILREACRTRQIDLCDQIEQEHEQLAIRYSHPRWLVQKWISQWGREETIRLLQANNATPPVALRFNPLKAVPEQTRTELEQQGVSLIASAYAPGAYRIERGATQDYGAMVQSGKVYIQDEASQLVASLLAVQPGMRVLDVCAAPGSKATQMAATMLNQGMIVAADVHQHRLRHLQQLSDRLGVTLIHPVVMDARQPLPLTPAELFDRVLVDAPCSGTGTLRHHPEIKWRLQQDDLTAMAQLQLALLTNAATMLACHGRLVYSTCSLEPEENEQVVEKFLDAHPQFKRLQPTAHPSVLTHTGDVRTFPHRHHADGFFAAVLGRHT